MSLDGQSLQVGQKVYTIKSPTLHVMYSDKFFYCYIDPIMYEKNNHASQITTVC